MGFIVQYARKFWKEFLPIRNAFTHNFRFLFLDQNYGKMKNGFENIVFLFNKDWSIDQNSNPNPIEHYFLTGKTPMISVNNLLFNIHYVEEKIIENHILSISSNKLRILPKDLYRDDLTNKENNWYQQILNRKAFNNIELRFDFSPSIKYIEKQAKLHLEFLREINLLGTKSKDSNVRENFITD
ncbi:MAG: hypothetical protein HeimC3_25970 [Candidatus Heimdallarchaeota archaeon LC_3]|nr:MAG: hypothetical protein HeimC3_25970 [Candidatus Heimdallarchaeota archaeon LC_3]